MIYVELLLAQGGNNARLDLAMHDTVFSELRDKIVPNTLVSFDGVFCRHVPEEKRPFEIFFMEEKNLLINTKYLICMAYKIIRKDQFSECFLSTEE